MKNKQAEFLEPAEVQDIFRTCDKTTARGLRDFCILALAVFTGLRRHEITTLTLGSLQSQAGRQYLYARTKGDRSKKVKIWDEKLLEALARYLNRPGAPKDPASPMFWSIPKGPEKKTWPITDETIRRVIEKAAKLAKISKRITPHSLRHTFLTQALRSGIDLATVQSLAGHANISTTSRYLHTTQERRDAAIEKLKF